MQYGLLEPLRAFGRSTLCGGTSAGAIFLSGDIHRDQPLLALMDITVQRNAFGAQVDSFEIDLDISKLGLKEAGASFHAFLSVRR